MTKEELQKQITELENEFNEKIADLWNKSNYVEENEPEESIYFWGLELGYSCSLSNNEIDGLLIVQKKVKDQGLSHGLGCYRTKEYAERVRTALIGLLQVYKNDEPHQNNEEVQYHRSHLCIDFERIGKEIIKQMDEGEE
jgi:hypothetical protein